MDTHHFNALVIGAGRLGRIEMVLAAIVLLLLVGEGSVVAVLRRMLGGWACLAMLGTPHPSRPAL